MSKRNKEGDEMQRRKHARLRFKRLVRVALVNHQWISEVDDQGITLNVKKNVAMLVRKKHKTGILTMAQKGLLATLHRTRTIAERKKLCMIVANLGCFTQVPPKIRARLVPHLHFMVVSAGRILMKEGDEPTCVYFVVSGEVEMSRKVLNKITRKYESKPEVFFGPGDWIGEIELLEDNIRMNTYTTTSNCEILVLDDTDFKSMLKPYVQKVWIEKKRAISSLSYLQFMSESQVISACKFGILRQYEPLSTIYPEEKDNILHVHFVLSGECVLLQCLKMKVSMVDGEVKYELPDALPIDSDEDVDDDKQEPFDVAELLRSSSSIDETGQNKKKAKRHAEFAKIEANCTILNQKPVKADPSPNPSVIKAHSSRSRGTLHSLSRKSMISDKRRLQSVHDDDSDELDYFDNGEDLNEMYGFSEEGLESESRQSDHLLPIVHSDIRSSKLSIRSNKSNKSRMSWVSRISRLSKLSKLLNQEAEVEESEIFTASSSFSASLTETVKSLKPIDESNYAMHFVDIGSMSFGGLCGVGEKCDHRVVMARTTVQCLLIPRYWLMDEDQNPGHIWQRMRFYLDRCIPSRETMFKDFIKTRKWAQFKDDCVEPFTHSVTNPTKIEDIPIYIRIVKTK